MKIFYVKIILIFIFGCSKSSPSYIDLEKSRFYFEEGNLEITDYVKAPLYINLDQSGDYYFTEVDKMIISDKYIYILDLTGLNHVYVFDLDGSFVSRIGMMGDGPNEYRRLGDFSVSEKEEIILLDRQRKKLLYFNTYGDFLSVKSFDFRADSFVDLKDGFLFGLVVESEVDELDGFQVIHTDSSMNVIQKYLEYPKGFMDVKFHTGLFTKSGNEIYYHKPVTDFVLKFQDNGKLEKQIELIFNNPENFETIKYDYGKLSELRSSKNFKYLNSPPIILGNLILAQGYNGDNKALFTYDLISGNYNIESIKPWNFNHLKVNFPYFNKNNDYVASILQYELYLVDWSKGKLPKEVSKHISDGGVTVTLYPLIK